jgi:hypothetical protein
MKPRLLFTVACLLVGAGTLAAMPSANPAPFPLQPVQDVYPDSTYEQIQQAIDNGGTVYFHRLTRSSGEDGEYDQLTRIAPDLPPTAEDPAKGFNVGRYGRDVEIIGLLGPNGERPKINGGTVVFRVGVFPGLGAAGLPVSFRIANLELSNPDLGPAATAFSRIGIWVNTLGARSTIDNCKITVTGKETDYGHTNNHSVAIWFLLWANRPQPPPSGALINVTNNTIIAARAHEGIHVDSFWPEMPNYTVPRAFVNNNSLHIASLGGYQNGQGTNGATLASAIVAVGNISESIVTNNTIAGDGRTPNVTPGVESAAILLGQANASGDRLNNVTVAGNDTSGYHADVQAWIQSVVSGSTIGRNSFGPADLAGVLCFGSDNRFVNNQFNGAYPGWSHPSGPGLFRFSATSSSNTVEAIKLNEPAHGFDICEQVLDESGGANEIRGDQRCRLR